MAQAVSKSGLFGIKTPEQAVALMLIAQAEGRHPATVARDYDIMFSSNNDAKGFGITAEWTAPQILALSPPRKTLWGLKPGELALLHEALRKAGDAGKRFRKTGPEFAGQNGGVPH